MLRCHGDGEDDEENKPEVAAALTIEVKEIYPFVTEVIPPVNLLKTYTQNYSGVHGRLQPVRRLAFK